MKTLAETHAEALAELQRLGRKKPADDREFLRKALQRAVKATGSEIGLLSVVVPNDATRLRAEASYVQGAAQGKRRYNSGILWEIGGEELPKGLRSLSGYVAHTHRTVCYGEVTKHPCYLAVDNAVHSELVVPILHAGSLIGVCNLESYKKDFYTAEHERFLSGVAACMAGAVARLRAGEAETAFRRGVTDDVAQLLTQRMTTSRDLLEATLRQMATRLDIRAGYARSVDGSQLVFKAACGPLVEELRRLVLPERLFLPIEWENVPEGPAGAFEQKPTVLKLLLV